jgi:class 3 adenylate cyclase/nitrite reductase/ring-hydroxylating ferredoxin subunit
MATVTCHPDDVDFEVRNGETLLEAGLRAGVGFAHACGGRAKCSTCRIWVLDGLDRCHQQNDLETAMATRLGFGPEVRLACQLRPDADLRVRRLVLDETDLAMCSQLDRAVATRAGEERAIAVVFSDVADSTSISEKLSPYDLLYLLNRYFVQVGDVIEKNGGYIDRFVGDGVMAIFGLSDEPRPTLRAVKASLELLELADRVKPFFAKLYGVDFDIRVGLHFGTAVIGSLGAIGHERITAIGEVPNVASRIEAANKEAGTRFLISEAAHAEVKDGVEVADYVRVRLRGTRERITLYEVGGLTAGAVAALAPPQRETVVFAGKTWHQLLREDELARSQWRIVAIDDVDIVITRLADDSYHAFSNACPHLHLPLFDRRNLKEGDLGINTNTGLPRPLCSDFTEDRGVVCRWHRSCFDLQTGEIREWAPVLNEDGTTRGWEFLGDVSRNRRRLETYPCRAAGGFVWLALD